MTTLPQVSEATGGGASGWVRSAPDPGSTPVVVVLDASGSMNDADAAGRRIDTAKRAVVDMVAALPDQARIGLLAYGTGTDSSDASRAAGCQDVRELVPVGPVDRGRLTDAVAGVEASGYTPIGAALRAAAERLPAAGPASIVLLSDGVDTCGPPSPCDTATELSHQHPGLAIHTIGFQTDDEAGRQLQCVADAGGGTFRSATDGAGLTAVLQNQVDAALRPYLVAGVPVQGTPGPPGAPVLTTGQSWDTLPAGPSVTRYYALRLAAGQTVDLAATVVPGALRGAGSDTGLDVSTELRDAADHRCLSTERESEPLLAGKVDPVTAVISGVVGGPEWSGRCPADGDFILAVTRNSTSSVPTPLELVVQVERPVAGRWPPVTEIPAAPAAPEPTAGTPTEGGSSFGSAPQLAAGTYLDSLSTGETRYYRIQVGWGQRISFVVTVDQPAGAAQNLGFARSAVANPMRQEVQLSASSNSTRDLGGATAVTLSGSTLVAAAYGNRDADRSDIRRYGRAGNYFLSVGLSYPTGSVPFRSAIRISVALVGDVLDGPRPAEPDSTGTVGAEPTNTSPPVGASGTTGITGSSAATDPGIRETGGNTVVIVAGIAGALIVVVAVLPAAVRRRRRLD